MIRMHNLKFKVTEQVDIDVLKQKAAKLLKVDAANITSIKISKKSIDARDKRDIYYIYSVDMTVLGKYFKSRSVETIEPFSYKVKKVKQQEASRPPIVVGFGPAGMMAALILAKAGLCPIVLERGQDVDSRKKDVDHFFRTASLNTESNVQFGEGGAGTFSDGKLTTGIHDKRCQFVLEQFVEAGAPEDILYSNKPHIGTDRLVDMVKSIREHIISLGGDIRFSNRLTDLIIEDGAVKGVVVTDANQNTTEILSDTVILAIGHSARDTLAMLDGRNVRMEQKSFAVGVRIEHPQAWLDTLQYGRFSNMLPPAEYKMAIRLPNGRSGFTFCMCPGGFVIPASSEEGGLVVNGMSHHARAAQNANSALIVSVNPSDFADESPLAGIAFQRNIEKAAFTIGGANYHAPVQLVGDFLADRATTQLGDVIPSYTPGVTPCDLREVLPDFVHTSLQQTIVEMDKKLRGFATEDAVLTGVETRTSSPVRMPRDAFFFSNIRGLMPCGEGCGYAGGIMSAAVDGIKCAEMVLTLAEEKHA